MSKTECVCDKTWALFLLHKIIPIGHFDYSNQQVNTLIEDVFTHFSPRCRSTTLFAPWYTPVHQSVYHYHKSPIVPGVRMSGCARRCNSATTGRTSGVTFNATSAMCVFAKISTAVFSGHTFFRSSLFSPKIGPSTSDSGLLLEWSAYLSGADQNGYIRS